MNSDLSFVPKQPVEDEDGQVRREAIVEQNAQLRDLTKSAAWGMVVAFIDDQSARRINEIMLTPATNDAEKVKEAHIKGEYGGLQLVKKFVTEQLGVTDEAVELYRQLAREQGEA